MLHKNNPTQGNNNIQRNAVNKHCVSQTQVSMLRYVSTGCIYKWVVHSTNVVDIHYKFLPVNSEAYSGVVHLRSHFEYYAFAVAKSAI